MILPKTLKKKKSVGWGVLVVFLEATVLNLRLWTLLAAPSHLHLDLMEHLL